MARFRDYSYDQAVMLPVALGKQLQPGSFEYAINHLVDHCIDRSVFEERYANDETGAPAIARACEENIIFMALSADTRPHFTTIANFISSMDEVIVSLFRDVLTICYAEGLIGRQGKPVKSNITDNESAKLVSSHGVIQGYNGIATVDAKHQIVVDAQAFGDGLVIRSAHCSPMHPVSRGGPCERDH